MQTETNVNEPHHVGFGILTWDGQERRSDRYGSVHLVDADYDQTVKGATWFDPDVIAAMVGKRVHMTCRVIRSRPSGHVGDLFHGIVPTTPDVGEVVDLGVGVLDVDVVDWDVNPGFVLRPNDGRAKLWMDPRRLYRLHDQTVALYLTVTDEPCSPVPVLNATDGGAIDNHDGSYQVKNRGNRAVKAILPSVRRVGLGMFVMEFEPDEDGHFPVRFEDDE